MSDKEKINKKCYQWKKGKSYGMCDIVQSIKTVGTEKYILFESGRLLAVNLIEEFLVEIPSLNEPLFIKENMSSELSQTHTKPIASNDIDGLKYPHESELINMKNGDKYSLGTATVIPHPNQISQPIVNHNNDITRGLVEEGKEHLITNRQNNIEQRTVIGNTQSLNSSRNEFDDIIKKTKKKEFDLELKITVKLPSQAFFEILDDEYLEENLDGILGALINKIKQTDLDQQIKKNLINIYNIKNNE